MSYEPSEPILVYNAKSLIYNCIVEEIIKSYSDQSLHAEIGQIIRAHSENRTDIRKVVNKLVAWRDMQRAIDLGCGYGWFEEGMRSDINKKLKLIVGIDYLPENKPFFIERAKRVADDAVFLKRKLLNKIDFPGNYFDFVICAYALYFFPKILSEVKRILRKGGIFVVVTHSESMLEEGKRFFDFRNLRTIIERFSAENGESVLKRHFRNVRAIDYPNSLVFQKGDKAPLSLYIDFKREFIRKDADPDFVRETMLRELSRNGIFRLNKDDRIFLVKK